MGGKSKMNNTEWGLVIGALFFLDTIQLVLTYVFLIGFGINEFLDAFVAWTLALYLYLRGAIDRNRLIVLIGGWIAEAGTDGGIPLWGLVGVALYFMSKGEKIIEQVPGGKAIKSIVEKK